MSYYVTNENSVLNINNAHLKVSGNVITDVMKLGAIEFAPPASNVGGTVNFTNVTTGVTTSSNLSVGGTLSLGTVEVVATTHTLANTTANGNVTPHTVQFSNATTGIVTTANVEVGGELAVSGNVSDLNVVSNVNMLHTSNTASIKVNSNVVTEFPRSKKLIRYPRVALTAASGESSGYQGYYVTESSNSAHTARHSWKAFNMTFDNTTGDNAWANDQTTSTYSGSDYAYNGSINLGTGAVNGEWIKLQLPHKIKLEYMKIWLKDNDSTRIPENWKLYGSYDNLNWTELFSKSGQGAVNENTYNVNTTSVYDYFAVVVTKISGQNNYFRIVELEYFGVPEYDPEADGVDVVVKSVPNVPNTDWLEVYYDAKDLADGALSTASGAITGLGGTTNSGTAYGGVTVSDGAFVLDGTNDYITTSALGFSGDQPYSISIWFRSDRPQTDMTTENGIYGFGYGNNLTAGLSWWSPVTNGSSSLRHWHSGSAGKNFPNTTFLEDMWNHIVIVYPGGGAFNIRAWLNDVELMGVNGTGSGGVNNDFSWSTSDSIIIGDWYNTSGPRLQSPWDGKIANFRLFNRALTSDEIYQLYAYQKEYFGHGVLGMTLKAGRLGIGTSEPRSLLQVGDEPFGPGSRPIFRAVNNSASTLSYDATQGTKIFTTEFDTTQINITNSYNTSTGKFTAPIPGYYFFEFQLLIAVPVANWGTVQLSFYKNGVNVNQANSSRGLSYYWVNNVDPGPDSFSHLNTPSCRAILYLNRGDYVQAGYPGIGSSTASSSFEYSKNYAFFQGYLLST